ncbi:hypothetical protein ZEAMMB73_Zm00001d030558 [Zea mays]|uniref:Uncharacterized protein n=1 Tax=Zea mays TaxID=4577 RepID=A0A1D6KCZ3_MAIZE|nr:hypothetical protein ZEAMMB73_Zm00001d030558 [Zea mays]
MSGGSDGLSSPALATAGSRKKQRQQEPYNKRPDSGEKAGPKATGISYLNWP